MANSSGVAWDIALAVTVGLIQLGLAYLGWRVSAPEHKVLGYIFVGVGFVGVVLTAVLAYRAASSQSELQAQLNRLLFKISDVSVSFQIKVPLVHPTLSGYRARVERCAEEIVTARQMRCGAYPRTVNISPEAPIKDFYLPVGSELFPNQDTESVAYTLLDQAAVNVSLFKDIELPEPSTKPDLKFMANKQLDGPDNVNASQNTQYVALYYDIASKSLFVEGNRVPINEATWYTNGKIAALPDLQGAYFKASPSVYLISLVQTSAGPRPTQEWGIAQQISQSVISLERVTLHMSKGYEFDFRKERLGDAMKGPEGELFYLTKIVE